MDPIEHEDAPPRATPCPGMRRRAAALALHCSFRACAAMLAGVLAAAPALGPAGASAREGLCLRGVNLSGAEFGAVPGRFGVNYTYPDAGLIRDYAARGASAIRLPILWERLQPRLHAPLDPAESRRLQDAVAAASAAGLTTIVDLHNFGYYSGQRVGSAAVPAEALADVWRRLAQRYGGDARVVLSLMNEPHDIPMRDWAATANTVIAAIRAAGARNLLLVPGSAYSGASRWTEDLPSGNNGRDMLAVVDPLDRFAFDIHQYLDADSSGTSPACDGAERALAGIDAVQAWLATHRRRAFLGEFAASDRPACVAALGAMVQRVNAHPQHWIGWTAWGAGPWWPPTYMFNLRPEPGADGPQLRTLAAAFRDGAGRPATCDTAPRGKPPGPPPRR